jgi:hypothetical protein
VGTSLPESPLPNSCGMTNRIAEFDLSAQDALSNGRCLSPPALNSQRVRRFR